DTANHQWKTVFERSFQDGYYNPNHRPTPVKLRGEDGIQNENLEKIWQNQLLPFYKTISTKNDAGNITSVNWTDQNMPNFTALLKEFYENGFDHDIAFIIDDLGRRRQVKGQGEIATIPPTNMLRTALENDPLYKTSAHFKSWADQAIDQVSRENKNAFGA